MQGLNPSLVGCKSVHTKIFAISQSYFWGELIPSPVVMGAKYVREAIFVLIKGRCSKKRILLKAPGADGVLKKLIENIMIFWLDWIIFHKNLVLVLVCNSWSWRKKNASETYSVVCVNKNFFSLAKTKDIGKTNLMFAWTRISFSLATCCSGRHNLNPSAICQLGGDTILQYLFIRAAAGDLKLISSLALNHCIVSGEEKKGKSWKLFL